MSIQKAIEFISKVDNDTDFRKSCYANKSLDELLQFTSSQDMSFTEDEIEDAFNMLELKCQTYSQAERVHEVKAWFKLFRKD